MIDRDDGYPTEAFYAEADPCESCGEHHLDIPALIEMFQHFYQEKLKGRAA